MLPITPFEQKVNQDSSKATYCVIVADYSPYATATDTMVLQNPANSGKTIRLTQARINGDATANAMQDVYLTYRTALNTGGTSTAQTPFKMDSSDPASSASVLLYSAAPTLNGTATLVRAGHNVFVAATPSLPNAELVYQFGDRAAKAPVLYPGTQIGFSLAGLAVATGLSLYFTLEWTEE